MEKGKKTPRAHCLVLAYPAQGHINPMLQFSKRLEHKGLQVTLVTTRAISNTIQRISSSTSIPLETISDGYDEGGRIHAENIQAYLERFWQVGSKTLVNLVERLNSSVSGCPVDCIIYDAFMPWGLDVSKKFGLVSAAFFTQSCAVDSIYYHVHKELIKLPVSKSELILLPGLPPLEPQDLLLSFIRRDHTLLSLTCFWISTPILIKQIGSFATHFMSWKKRWWIGLPSSGHSEQLDLLYHLWEQQLFLWVVRESEEAKLPENFLEETSNKGLVVTWCSQLEVLAHEAVGCFLTHCGWNSSLEALSLGVPMVAMPQRTDQSTNAKYIMDVWKMGLKTPVDEKGIARWKSIQNCIEEIMEGEKGKEIKRNASKWRQMTKQAVDAGGSSDKNIDEFVDAILHISSSNCR
ncbi:hypothetical protein GH714_024363 [Hevea brasiliensis]|uniref:Glycosyltransferase n=1 Tax=Hevea brasiliensis TaxID=3981 RepID=A0A6A6KV78_HEVBR|nr:hypothetical protein GH714_024363 [Hevea brasiliensis]